ncbi:MAG TPA: D-arabinono-1,4-lactone oxidase, partial [Enhygromyxa sp.]|nr:D-arabinono-1,4-lactone oxidase [Enhygromyxa sp.]
MSTSSWQNWARTIEFTPTRLVTPKTVDELREALQAAVDAALPVRVAGSGHSWSLGVVPGRTPYRADGPAEGVLIDLVELEPRHTLRDRYLKAIYFADQSGTWYLSAPPGTPQGWAADNAANRHDPLHVYDNEHPNLALASMGPAPDINLGGFLANGCHGTGWQQPTVADLLAGVELLVVDKAGKVDFVGYAASDAVAAAMQKSGAFRSANVIVDPEAMAAIRVSLGALGVITKFVLQLEPLFRAKHLDEYVDLDALFPSNGDPGNLATLVTSSDYTEIFWFPFTPQLWVKRYSLTAAPVQHRAQVIGFELITSVLAKLTGGLLGGLFGHWPAAAPPMMNLFWAVFKVLMGERKLTSFEFDGDWTQSDPIVEAPDAYLYQKLYFTNIVDLSYTVPIVATSTGHDFGKVMQAWNDAVAQIETMRAAGQYPVNLNVHIRFIKNSSSLLSPANQAEATTHTCYIEFLSFSEVLSSYADYAAAVGPKWASLGGLPHWAKILQLVPGVFADSHAKLAATGHLQRFDAVRERLDPQGVFRNAFVDQLLTGRDVPTSSPKVELAAVPDPVPLPAVPRPKAGLLQSNEVRRSARGAHLVMDHETGLAVLADEGHHGYLLRFVDDPAAGELRFELLWPLPSRLLAAREIS